jgi:hypothetical protein
MDGIALMTEDELHGQCEFGRRIVVSAENVLREIETEMARRGIVV